MLRSLARLLPLSFIPLLVPAGSPQDDAFDIGQADDEGDQVGLGMQQQSASRRGEGGLAGEAEEGGEREANGGGGGEGGAESALSLRCGVLLLPPPAALVRRAPARALVRLVDLVLAGALALELAPAVLQVPAHAAGREPRTKL